MEKILVAIGWLLTIALAVSYIVIVRFSLSEPWVSPMSRNEKWKRSIITILGNAILTVVFSLFFILFRSPGRIPPLHPTIELVVFLLCLFTPINIVISVVGTFARINEIERKAMWHNQLLETIKQSKNIQPLHDD